MQRSPLRPHPAEWLFDAALLTGAFGGWWYARLMYQTGDFLIANWVAFLIPAITGLLIPLRTQRLTWDLSRPRYREQIILTRLTPQEFLLPLFRRPLIGAVVPALLVLVLWYVFFLPQGARECLMTLRATVFTALCILTGLWVVLAKITIFCGENIGGRMLALLGRAAGMYALFAVLWTMETTGLFFAVVLVPFAINLIRQEWHRAFAAWGELE